MTTGQPLRAPPETELVWRFFGERKEGFFLDIGANEPQKGSQTWVLEERGWRGILVEPQALLCERLRQARPRSRVFQVACGAPGAPAEMTFYTAESLGHSGLVKNLVDATTRYTGTETVKVMTLDAVLAEAGNPGIDFMTMDVEGTQFDVLRGFDLQRHRPKLLMMEDHLYDLKAHRHLVRAGYRLAKRTGLNNWYVPSDSNFGPATLGEKYRLWKKVWANTPFRKARVLIERWNSRRAAGQIDRG